MSALLPWDKPVLFHLPPGDPDHEDLETFLPPADSNSSAVANLVASQGNQCNQFLLKASWLNPNFYTEYEESIQVIIDAHCLKKH